MYIYCDIERRVDVLRHHETCLFVCIQTHVYLLWYQKTCICVATWRDMNICLPIHSDRLLWYQETCMYICCCNKKHLYLFLDITILIMCCVDTNNDADELTWGACVVTHMTWGACVVTHDACVVLSFSIVWEDCRLPLTLPHQYHTTTPPGRRQSPTHTTAPVYCDTTTPVSPVHTSLYSHHHTVVS